MFFILFAKKYIKQKQKQKQKQKKKKKKKQKQQNKQNKIKHTTLGAIEMVAKPAKIFMCSSIRVRVLFVHWTLEYLGRAPRPTKGGAFVSNQKQVL